VRGLIRTQEKEEVDPVCNFNVPLFDASQKHPNREDERNDEDADLEDYTPHDQKIKRFQDALASYA
jgi:hypothetical protein